MSYRAKLLIAAIISGLLSWTQIIPEGINTLYKIYTGSDTFIVTSYYILVPTIVLSFTTYIIFPIITIYCLTALVRDYIKERKSKINEKNADVLISAPQNTITNSTIHTESLTAIKDHNMLKKRILKILMWIVSLPFLLFLLVIVYEAIEMIITGRTDEFVMALTLMLLALIPFILIGGLVVLITWATLSIIIKLLKK